MLCAATAASTRLLAPRFARGRSYRPRLADSSRRGRWAVGLEAREEDLLLRLNRRRDHDVHLCTRLAEALAPVHVAVRQVPGRGAAKLRRGLRAPKQVVQLKPRVPLGAHARPHPACPHVVADLPAICAKHAMDKRQLTLLHMLERLEFLGASHVASAWLPHRGRSRYWRGCRRRRWRRSSGWRRTATHRPLTILCAG